MIWQDIVLMICGLVFAPALVISITRKTRYPLATSLPTAIALTVMIVCYITLHLYQAAWSTGLTATCWYILAIRR